MEKTSDEIVASLEKVIKSDDVSSLVTNNSDAARFAQLGKELLEKTNRPNIITLDQFTPFIPLFKVDQERYDKEEDYRKQLGRMFERYRVELSINLYEPTIVVRSKTDSTELYFLDRLMTRIQSDVVDGRSNRDEAISKGPRGVGVNAGQVTLDASFKDLMVANASPDQKNTFLRSRIQSALIATHFARHNISPEKHREIFGDTPVAESVKQPAVVRSTSNTTIIDD
jgi:hypothetical protein